VKSANLDQTALIEDEWRELSIIKFKRYQNWSADTKRSAWSDCTTVKVANQFLFQYIQGMAILCDQVS
jgi:hypothetical protein